MGQQSPTSQVPDNRPHKGEVGFASTNSQKRSKYMPPIAKWPYTGVGQGERGMVALADEVLETHPARKALAARLVERGKLAPAGLERAERLAVESGERLEL